MKRVVISRKWAKPQIEAFVTDTEVGSSMALEDFLAALVEEMGAPTMLMTKAQLLSRMLAVKDKVTTEMKSATKAVV